MKRLATDWEKIFAKHISDKGHILLKLFNNKNTQIKTGKDLNRCRTKENIQIAYKHMRRYSLSYVTREL